MKTFINTHFGESDDEVLKILEEHQELWGSIEKSDLCHTFLYDVYDENGTLLAFFGNSYCFRCIFGVKARLIDIFVEHSHKHAVAGLH